MSPLEAAPDFVGNPHDFDFLVGTWTVVNRRLRQRGVGSSDWDEFEAEYRGWSLLDGWVSVDEMRVASRGFSGCSLRTLDRAAQRWSIYWVDSTDGRLFPPVHGGFDGARGEFHGEDVDDGRPVRVRYRWTLEGPDAARWEQAFSPDGVAWETNWVMQFRRA
jgi:hypothetical protein